jgi:hypothetical protein
MRWLAIMLMATLLAMAPGYGSAQPAGQKDPSPATRPQSPEVKAEPGGTAKSSTPGDRKAYEKKTAEELDAIQTKISELRIKAATGASQKKELIMRMANNLQRQKIAAENQLTALQKASETAWSQGKADLDKAMASLRNSLKAAEGYPK